MNRVCFGEYSATKTIAVALRLFRVVLCRKGWGHALFVQDIVRRSNIIGLFGIGFLLAVGTAIGILTSRAIESQVATQPSPREFGLLAATALIIGSSVLIIGVALTARSLNVGARHTPAANADAVPIRQVIKALQDKVEGIERLYSERNIETLASEIKKVTATDIAELVRDEFLETYSEKNLKEKGFNTLRLLGKTHERSILTQVDEQRNSGNVNLLWGIIFAICGLFAMGYFLLFSYSSMVAATPQTWNQFLMNFIPRFSFVVIFEGVALFFLRSYAEDRNIIRYLRNEATNIQAKTLALDAAIYFGDQEILSKSISALMATERNFTLRKGDKLILEALTKDHPMVVDQLWKRLIPDVAEVVKPADVRRDPAHSK